MWKKDEEKPGEQKPVQDPSGKTSRGSRTAPSKPAIIGPSIAIEGDVSGDEDLLIHGRVDGSVDLDQHSVTVGAKGRVNAQITGRVVIVEGEVEGDLKADEQVILRSAARVEGDITAPRVVLEDGAAFKGLVDMSRNAKQGGRGSTTRSGASTGSGKSTGSEGTSSSGSSSTPDDSTKSSSDAAGTSDKKKATSTEKATS